MAVPVVYRDSLVTDPFFHATRQILEKCLYEISHKYQEIQGDTRGATTNTESIPGSLILCCCCCCCHQDTQTLGNWAPAALIPCLNCCPTQTQMQDCQQSHFVQHPGQLSFTHSNFELILNVHGFQPHQMTVSVKDDFIEVIAQQEPTAQPHTSQSILKRYKLPHFINNALVQCSLSKDGILVLTAPWK